jgi:hypothetical protein
VQLLPQFVDVTVPGVRITRSEILAVLFAAELGEVNVSPGAPVSQRAVPGAPVVPPVAANVVVFAVAERLMQPGPEPPLSVAVVDGSAKARPLARNQVAMKATDIAASRNAIRSLDPSEGPTTFSLVLINPHLLVR